MLFDATSTIGLILITITQNFTGSMFLTLLYISLILMALAGSFGLPLEISIPFLIPFLIGGLLISGELLSLFGVVLIYLALIMTKRFIL